MAELGIAAATVQFLDVGARLLIILSRVCTDLRQVLHNIEAAGEKLREFTELVRKLEAEVHAPNAGAASTLNGALSPAQVDYGTSLLKQCIDQAEELEKVLRTLVSDPADRALKKAWRAVVCVKTEKDISDKLQELKTSLSLWYNHESFALLKNQALASERIEDGLKQLDQRCVSIASSITSSETINRATYDSVQVLVRESRSVQARLSSIEHNVLALNGRSEQLQNVSVTLSQSDCDGLSTHTCRRIVTEPQTVANGFSDETFERISPAKSYIPAVWKPRPGPSAPCTCSVSRSRWQVSWPLIFVHYDSREEHQRGCPWSWRSHVQWTAGVRFLLPGLLARSVHVRFSATHGAGGHTLTPSLTSVRVVDRRKSPGFRAIDSAREELVDTLEFPTFEDVKAGIPRLREKGTYSREQKLLGARATLGKLRSELQSSFCAGKASPRDQDVTGSTLFHQDVVLLALSLFELQDSLLDQISGIISMLVEGGVDVNATLKSDLSTTPANALEMVFAFLGRAVDFHDPSKCYESLRLDSVLTQHGCEATEESAVIKYSYASTWAYQWASSIFIRNPVVALECGYSQLCLAVVQRSETELRRLIRRGHNVQRELGRSYSPLSLAIGWTVGIRILLEAGAHPFTATLHAIGRREKATIEMLLPRCPMFCMRNPSLYIYIHTTSYSVLSYALSVASSRTVIRAIVKRLVEDRRQLADLALQNLSPCDLQRIGLTRADIELKWLHGRERLLVKALSQKGTKIPERLLPCGYVTVYHDKNMDVHTADELWAHGFRAIDIPDAWGCTPLLIASKNHRGEMVRWYIEKGASPKGSPRSGIPSCLHIVAAETGLTGNLSLYQNTLELLNQKCGAGTPDFCTCACSKSGCLPFNLLLKHNEPHCGGTFWQERSQRLDTWISLSRINYSDKELCYAEACRLEVFERLGMTHTCCRPGYTMPDHRSYLIPCMLFMEEEEQSTLRARDGRLGLVQTLQAYLQLYETLRVEYPEPISMFWIAWWSTLTDILPQKQRFWNGEGWRSRGVTARTIGKKDPTATDNREVRDDLRQGSAADGDRKKTDDQEPSDKIGRGFRLNETAIRSGMEFFLGGGGIALIEDVFGVEESEDYDSGAGDGYDEESDGDSE